MVRVIIFDEKNGAANYCGCQNCHGGKPVYLPKIGQRVYSTGAVFQNAHQPTKTLFMTADRSGAMYVRGEFPPYIPGVGGEPRRIFKQGGFQRLALVLQGGDGQEADINKVAYLLSAWGTPEEIEGRMIEWGFSEGYIQTVVMAVSAVEDPPSAEDARENSGYHCYGDIFAIGGTGVGEDPSFLFGWVYGDSANDTRSPADKEWDAIIPKIEAGELPEPEFIDFDSARPHKEIKWQGRTWRRNYQRCPGKGNNWVATGSKWKSDGDWYEVK